MADEQLVNQLAALRTKLLAADIGHEGSLSAVFSAFLDLVEGTDFVRESRRTEDPVVEETIVRLMRRFTGDDRTRVEAFRMLGYAPAGVVHGGFSCGGQMGTFFYYTGEGQGLVALHGGGARVDYFRITTTAIPAGAVPMRGPKGVQ